MKDFWSLFPPSTPTPHENIRRREMEETVYRKYVKTILFAKIM
jgi:hypothetical protein